MFAGENLEIKIQSSHNDIAAIGDTEIVQNAVFPFKFIKVILSRQMSGNDHLTVWQNSWRRDQKMSSYIPSFCVICSRITTVLRLVNVVNVNGKERRRKPPLRKVKKFEQIMQYSIISQAICT